MRKLASSPSLVDLQLLASHLENQGIAVEILNEHQGGNPGVPHWGLSVWAELWVRDPSQYAQAAELVANYQQQQGQEVVGEWTCGACGEASPSSFESCWKCGRDQPLAT